MTRWAWAAACRFSASLEGSTASACKLPSERQSYERSTTSSQGTARYGNAEAMKWEAGHMRLYDGKRVHVALTRGSSGTCASPCDGSVDHPGGESRSRCAGATPPEPLLLRL